MKSGRFAVLRHESPRGLHWDVLFEQEESLLTWAVAKPPELCTAETPADKLPDHRKVYLDYEGPISGGRGVVFRYDQGTYLLLEHDQLAYQFRVSGKRLNGVLVLVGDVSGQTWRLLYRPEQGVPTS